MSLELIDFILESWESEDYKGFLFYNIKNDTQYTHDDYIKERIIKDFEQTRYLKQSVKKVVEYGNTIEDLIAFYKEYNMIISPNKTIQYVYKIDLDSFEGELEAINKFISQLNPAMKNNLNYIAEIGFGGGFTTLNFAATTKATIITFDPFDKTYNWYGKTFIDEKYPNRCMSIIGPQKDSIATLNFDLKPTIKFDLIWFNETRDNENIYNIILNLRKYSHAETFIMLNNVAPHNPWGISSYLAMLKLLDDNIVIYIDHIKIGETYRNGTTILKFNFEEDKRIPVNKNVYKNIEMNIPLRELQQFIQHKISDTNYDEDLIREYTQKLIKANILIPDYIIKSNS